MAGKGGKLPGAGRKKGVPNKNTLHAHLRERLMASGVTPMEFLTEVMRSSQPKQKPGESSLIYAKRLELWARDRMAAATAVAPYYHSKLTSIEVKGEEGGPIQHQHRFEIEFVSGKKGVAK